MSATVATAAESIAVLPFESLSENKANAYFASEPRFEKLCQKKQP